MHTDREREDQAVCAPISSIITTFCFSHQLLCGFQDGSGTEMRIRTLSHKLEQLVYEYVCRSLFKADRLMFAMHMAHGTRLDLFGENVSGSF